MLKVSCVEIVFYFCGRIMKDHPKELNQITELFYQYGVKSLTMDDIARHLGISKKTLYQQVKDKKELVLYCVQQKIRDNQEEINEKAKTIEGNAIDILMAVNEEVSLALSHLHPSILYELQRYYPEAFQVINDHKEQFIYDMTIMNLELGMEQGLYRKNLNPQLIAQIYVHMCDTLINNVKFQMPDYSINAFHKELIRYHIRGIASNKGIEYLANKFNHTDI